tara:strand:- start:25 stop:852 length:828 start_codon:yes stop_codon:yes gene_type:complete
MSKSVLVTGSGFLSKNIVELLGDKYDVVYTTRDRTVNDMNALVYDFTQDKLVEYFDVVIHNASYIPKPEDKNDILCSEVNSNGSIHLFNQYKDRCKHFIYISSLSIYGGISENNITEQTYPQPNSDYAFSKFVAENRLKVESKECILTILRPGTIYGKHMENDRIIPFILNELSSNNKFEVWNEDEYLNIVNVKDVVEVIDTIIENDITDETYNLAVEHLSKREITDIINDVIDSKSEIIYKKSDKELFNKTYDISKVKTLKKDFIKLNKGVLSI